MNVYVVASLPAIVTAGESVHVIVPVVPAGVGGVAVSVPTALLVQVKPGGSESVIDEIVIAVAELFLMFSV